MSRALATRKRGRPALFSAPQQLAIAAAVEFHHRNGAPLRGGSRHVFRTLRLGAWQIVADKLGRRLGAEAVKKIHDKHKHAVRTLSRVGLRDAMKELPTPLRLRVRVELAAAQR